MVQAVSKRIGQRPALWRYVVAGCLALLVLVPAWILVVMLVLQPDSLMSESQTMADRVLWWIAGPVLVVGALVGWRWIVAQRAVEPGVAAPTAAGVAATAAPLPVARTEVLEILGLGITVDKYRQGQLWTALSSGNAAASIRESDPKKYPWSDSDKRGQAATRVADAVRNGLQGTPAYWGVPVFNAAGPVDDPDLADRPDDPKIGISDAVGVVGLHWHLLVIGPRRFEERPDRLLEEVFSFFDSHPDVPYVVLTSHDGPSPRDLNRAPGAKPSIFSGHYVPEMPDTNVVLVLARRERVEALRKWAFEDLDEASASVEELNRRGVARRLYLAYSRFRDAHETRTSAGRAPLVDEWLALSSEFARNPDIYPDGVSPWLNQLNPASKLPERNYKPTPWFPVPWNKQQLQEFDALPTLGYLHRPVFVKTVDEEGKPLARKEAKAAVLAAGWKQAVQGLRDNERKAAPSRIVAATAGDTEQTIALHSVLNQWAEEGGPDLDSAKATQWIDADRRLGNTGAATWFTQIGIGVMGSYLEGGVSAAVNLRDSKEASIVFVSPPPESKRKAQGHSHLFQHEPTPVSDPADYQQQ